MSHLEDSLVYQIKERELPAPEQEYRFHKTRRWRFDLAWPALKLAAEVEGGTWAGGRHTRGSGYEKDCEKYNAAVLDGWAVMRFTGSQIKKQTAIKMIEQALLLRAR